MIKVFINLLLTLTGIAYPIIWLLANNQQMLFHLPWIMAVLWAVKGCFQQQGQRYFAWSIALILAVVAFTRSIETMFWYPIIINGLMLSLFGSSLWSEQTVVERLARLQTPDLNEAGVRLTRERNPTLCGGVFFKNPRNFWGYLAEILRFLGTLHRCDFLLRYRCRHGRRVVGSSKS